MSQTCSLFSTRWSGQKSVKLAGDFNTAIRFGTNQILKLLLNSYKMSFRLDGVVY